MKILLVLLLVNFGCSNNTRKRMEALTMQLIRDDNDDLLSTRNDPLIPNQESNRETASEYMDSLGAKLSALLARADLTKNNPELKIRTKQRASRKDDDYVVTSQTRALQDMKSRKKYPTSLLEGPSNLDMISSESSETNKDIHRNFNVLDLSYLPTSHRGHSHLNVLDLIVPPMSDREGHENVNVLDLMIPQTSHREGHRNLNVLGVPEAAPPSYREGHRNLNVRNLVNSDMQQRDHTGENTKAGRLLYSSDNEPWRFQTKNKLHNPLNNIDNLYNSISASDFLKQSLANSILDKGNFITNDLAVRYPSMGQNSYYRALVHSPSLLGFRDPLKNRFSSYMSGPNNPNQYIKRISRTQVDSVSNSSINPVSDKDATHDNRNEREDSDSVEYRGNKQEIQNSETEKKPDKSKMERSHNNENCIEQTQPKQRLKKTTPFGHHPDNYY